MSDKPLVGILMGSDSDYEIMAEAARALREFGVPFEVTVTSAHRTPERTSDYVRQAPGRGLKVLIAGAGAAAHLAGVVAAETTLPVIAVPIDATALNGLDALLAMVQMPAGIPVATMAIGKAGARNAGIFAAQILAVADPLLRDKLTDQRQSMAAGVVAKAEKLQERLRKDGF
ncbi:5-(carboxyamino)imidazole ribonucleotide mutase [Geothermobacter hydrogeniphilus]|uniref:N5-carboxyaminoimidazole ribonucleotide mutase n=1 Tax=Geothermobacter hydrogeniphilus TaxID=1969733 RepID=A0A2K2H5Y7_9BACT|nr:5-(carboxyamino)imidazole ribonucleotide mutase [Geothermobacter hydrogeniphilus]PNU18734.1 5-(carboxyamino)imidazole ribonucleotide mutase [Geothermobacter hydrogeniphilus]